MSEDQLFFTPTLCKKYNFIERFAGLTQNVFFILNMSYNDSDNHLKNKVVGSGIGKHAYTFLAKKQGSKTL